MRLGFVHLEVNDLDGMSTWYQDVLQGEISYKDAEHGWTELAIGSGGDASFAFSESDRPQDTSEHRAVVPAVEVDDLSATARRLEASGVSGIEIREGRRASGAGYRWITVRDPEDNVFRMYEWV